MSGMTLAQRLEANSRAAENGCRVWTMKKSPKGYATLKHKGVRIPAHRAAFELAHGSIPEGLVVCHRCDNPSCINPDHLFLGTHHDNIKDCISKGRRADFSGSSHGASKLDEAAVLAIRTNQSGMSRAQLAEHYSVSRAAISDIKSGRSWVHVGGPLIAKRPNSRGAKGERSPTAKMTEQMVRSIYSDCRTHKEIAASYGVRKTAVSEIKSGRKWAHLKLGEGK